MLKDRRPNPSDASSSVHHSAVITIRARAARMRAGIAAAAMLATVGATLPASRADAATTATELGELSSVSCPTDAFCMAVGARHQSSGALLGLAYRWDGTSWHVMPTPSPPPGRSGLSLNAVSCTSETFCTAFGRADNATGELLIAERWNGSFWRYMTIQRPGWVLGATVSCVAKSSCIAVGSRLAAARSSASCPHSDCYRPVTWKLVGNTFELRRAAPRPFPIAYLTSVSCTARGNCTAVGDETSYTHPLAEHWNGHKWSWLGKLPYPHRTFTDFGPYLSGVSCPAPGSCVAVGGTYDDEAFVENRNAGGAWHYGLPLPDSDPEGDGGTGLASVSCSVFQRCAAVGIHTDFGGDGHGVLAWRDFRTGGFTRETSPAFFGDVSCRTAGCVYVGTDVVFEGSGVAGEPVIYRGRAHPIQQAIPAPPA